MRDYTEHVGGIHRKKFGQFFTHPSIALFMTRWVIQSETNDIFDPGFGLGAFYEQLPDEKKNSFKAMELDAEILKFWKKASGFKGRFITQSDYLHAWGLRHENIVCNPPYMRFQKFMDRNKVFSEFRANLHVKLSGYTNTASAFLIKSLSELKKGGRLAYIMPLEFLNAGYGVYVKKKLLEGKHLFGILSLECEKEIFPDATTSVGIILFDSSKELSSVKFYSFKDLKEIESFSNAVPVSEITWNQLRPEKKWLPFFKSKTVEINEQNTTPLTFYGRFSRGIATGANEFFSLNRTKITELRLNETSDCIPCISKSSQIKEPFFSSEDLDCLIEADKSVLLFSVNGNPSPEAKAYIKAGESNGFHRRFLTKNRNPWYGTENRKPAPILLGVFSRCGYKVVRNKSSALNLTCFHGFQPNLFGNNYLDYIFLFLSSNTGREVMSLESRKYGDALDKFEPNDINQVSVPSPEFFDSISDIKLKEALNEYKTNHTVPLWLETKFKEILLPENQAEATPDIEPNLSSNFKTCLKSEYPTKKIEEPAFS